MTAGRRAELLWHTVRYLRPAQILSRLRLQTQSMWRRRSPNGARARYERAALRLGLAPSERRWKGAPARLADEAAASEMALAAFRAQDAEAGRFRFLNTTHAFGRPIAWDAATASQLWRYQLHYGGYLVDLAATRSAGWPAVASLMREWMEANPIGQANDAWHPFVVSERLVNWIVAIHLAAPASRDISDDIWRSLAMQSVFVDRNLEHDVGGNHLLKNLKAMVVAGCFWQGTQADRWRERYVETFTRELNAQLLTDGAHYERSPMYHALVLEDALEVVCALRAAGHAVPATLVEAARAMDAYLPHVTHPDGGLALFNDSVFGEAPSSEMVRAFAAQVLDDRPASGAMTVRQAAFAAGIDGSLVVAPARTCERGTEDGGLVSVPALGDRGFLLVDVGPACPDDLPAHAHADLFSFELTLDGARLIVDSGVGEYQAGPWRDYYRSTRAHNTVAVDGQDQIECWSSFRVARRARIHGRQAITGALIQGVTARHDGYARLRQPVDAWRTLVRLDDRAWLVIDELEGPGSHTWESFLHAAPGVALELSKGTRGRLRLDQRSLAVAWFGPLSATVVSGVLEPPQGWYAPEFGCRVPAAVLVLDGAGPLPVRFGYVLSPDVEPSETHAEETADGLVLRLGSSQYLVRGRREQLRAERMVGA